MSDPKLLQQMVGYVPPGLSVERAALSARDGLAPIVIQRRLLQVGAQVQQKIFR